MAEAYRGLTIRIGADTSNLRSAMTNLKSASNALQRDFRRMSNAFRVDPHNADLARARIKTLGNAAGAASAEAARLNRALREAGHVPGFKNASASMEQLATQTRNAQVQAEHTRDSYNLLDKRLESLYNTIAKNNLGANATEEKLKEERERVKALAHDYDNLSRAKRTEFNSYLRGLAGENPLGLQTMGGKAASGATYISVFKSLREEWRKTYAELQKADAAVGLENIANDALLAESRVRQLEAEFTKLLQDEVRLGSGKVKELANEFDRVSVHAREAQNHIERMDEALRLSPHSVNAASQKMAAFNERTRATTEQLSVLRRRMNEMKAQGFEKAVAEAKKLGKSAEQVGNEFTEARSRVKILSGQLQEARLEVERIVREGRMVDFKEAAAEVNRLEIELNKAEHEAEKVRHEFNIINEEHEFRKVSEEIALAEARLSAYNRELRESIALNKANFGASIKNLGYAGLSTVTPAVMMAGMYMIQGANDIDAAYRNMRKTVQGTEQDFEKLKDAAQEFASHGVVSTDQVLEIQAMGGQLGIAVDKLDEFSEAIANITIATTITDASLAAEQLGQMANIMTDMREGLAAGEDVFGKYSDMIVRLGNNSATTEDKITQVLQRIAASGNLFGFTTPQLAALATAVASSGQGAEAAGTAISRSFSQIETACAKGGESLDKFAAVAGMSAEEFASAWEEDAMGAYIAFIEGLKKIDEAGGSVDQTLIDLGINSVREKQTLESLVNMTDVLNNSLIMSQDAWNGVSDEFGQAGDAAREAQRKAEGFSGQLAILKNNGQILASELAEGMVPILTLLNSIVQNVTETFSHMPDAVKTGMIAIAGLAAAVGPLAVVFGVSITSFYNMSQNIEMMGGAWEKAARQMLKAGEVVEVLSEDIEYNGQIVKKGTRVMRDAEGSIVAIEPAGEKGSRGIRKIGKAFRAFGKMAGPMLGVVAAIAAIGAVVGVIESARAKTKALEKATDGLKNATGGLGTNLDTVTSYLSSVGNEASTAALDVDELTESLGDHVDRINEINHETQTTIGQLDYWQNILNHAIQDSDWGAEHIGEVEYAVQQINEATGMSLDANQLISGEYENQEELVNRICEAEKRRVEQEAAMNVLTETKQAEYDAYLTYMEKEAEYERQIAEARESHPELAGLTDEQVVAGLPYLQKAYDEATESAELYAAACESSAYAEQYLNNTTAEVASTVSELSNKLQESDFDIFEGDDAEVLDSMGTSYDELAESFKNLGLTVADLNEMGTEGVAELIGILTGENGYANAAAWLDEMGYGLDEVSGDAEHLATVVATIDGKRHVFTVTSDGTLEEQGQAVEDFNAIQIDDKWYVIDDNGTGYNALGVVNEVDQAKIDAKLAEIRGDAKGAWSAINGVVNYNIPNKSVSIVAKTASLVDSINAILSARTFKANVNAVVSAAFGGRAAGGIIGHAAGGFNGIVRRPILTNQGLIGEAGAEAVMRWAGGTAIVPLENRQYVRPFAQSVAQEMPMAFGAYGGVTAGEIAAALANMNLQVRMDSGELVGVLVNNSRRRAAMNV